MQGQTVTLDGVTMAFGDFVAVRDANLEIAAGEFFSFLGPSGCGKTTILRIVSGFNRPTAGRVRIGGQDMTGIGANRRPTALIFQNLALFPLMKVWENIAFGLEVRGVDRRTRQHRADELLALVALDGQGDKLVSELSGGQRQRVAIARALAVEPSVLLLDEPLSALDLKLRQHMRAELRAIQRQTGVTFVYITHDQGEALTMSDRVAVMRDGAFEQIGTPEDVYDRPATSFVATFVGECNAFAGTIARTAGGEAEIETAHGALRAGNPHRLGPGDRAILFVRPERCRVATPDDANALSGRLARIDFEGPFVNLFVDHGGAREAMVHLTNLGDEPHLAPGSPLRIGFAPEAAVVLPEGDLAHG